MKNKIKYIAGLVAVLLLSGCFPEQKMVWSPDGKQAVVLSDGGLYRCDPDGTLSEKLLDDVIRIAWRKDSHGLVMARIETVSNWKDAQKLICPEEVQELIAIGDAVHAAWLQTKNMASATDLELSSTLLSDNQMVLVSFYLRYRYPDLAGDVQQSEPVEMNAIQLATLDDSGIQTGQVVCGASDQVFDLRISPADNAIAYSVGDILNESTAPVCLYVASLNGTGVFHRVASGACLYPDWSKDGLYLVYAASNIQVRGGEDLVLGAIARRKVADVNGLVETMPDKEDLVGLIMNPLVRVRCLPDNSIAFSAFEVQLPAVAGDMPAYMNFYRFDPLRPARAERMFPRSIEPYLGDTSMLFEPSPDGRRMAFIDAEKRAVIVTVATGELQEIPDSFSDVFLPSWRGNDEITCFCTVSNKQSGVARDAVVRYTINRDPAVVELSASWPEDVLKNLSD